MFFDVAIISENSQLEIHSVNLLVKVSLNLNLFKNLCQKYFLCQSHRVNILTSISK